MKLKWRFGSRGASIPVARIADAPIPPAAAVARITDEPVAPAAAAARIADVPIPPAAAAEGSSGQRMAASQAEPVADLVYRCPTDLAVSQAPLRRVLFMGSCLTASWPEIFSGVIQPCQTDYVLIYNVPALPPDPPHPVAEYDFHLLQIPLRALLPERAHMRLPYDQPEAYVRLFEDTRERLAAFLDGALRWNRAHGIPTFVCTFLQPQQNPMGRLLPRYDLRNMVHFIERLNEALAQELQRFANAHLVDLNEIAATYGRRYLQDDVAWLTSHGAALGDMDWENDQARIETPARMTELYPQRTFGFVQAALREVLALYRTLRQTDMVKLVLIDLDDTLWRGVLAEAAEIEQVLREGWPLGFVEALLVLKRRGVLLGIVSKNDEARAAELLRQMYGDMLSFEDFAVRRINWRPKAENIEEILAEVNLLPRSVLFIDDNPVERASVQAAFPELRVLGANPYLWRRILLWSPETQLAAITAESASRTGMVQAQIRRENSRRQMTREEFLTSLGVRVQLCELAGMDHPDAARVLELINKTNQFNTTGQRRGPQDCAAFLAGGGRFWTLRVDDRHASYGLVGVLAVAGGAIEQFVMSCRVVGLEVEIAAIAGLLAQLVQRGHAEVTAALVETPANLLCRDLWPRCGFLARDGHFLLRDAAAQPLAVPPHIALTVRTPGEKLASTAA